MPMPVPLPLVAGDMTPPVLIAVAERCRASGLGTLNTGWEDVLVPHGMQLAGNAFHRSDWHDWAESWIERHLEAGIRHLTGDEDQPLIAGQPNEGIYLGSYSGDWGFASLLAEDHHTPTPERLRALEKICDHILHGSVRGPDGVIFHDSTRPEPWVDTLYYTAVPLAMAASVLNRSDYAAEAIDQCLLHARLLRDPRTGCFFHEYSPTTGQRSGWLWSRGNGWVVMSFADVLSHCPPQTVGYSELRDLYVELVEGLLRLQHPNGLWRIVPENTESHLETSGSAMIGTGIAKGIRHGLVPDTQGAYLWRLWHELTEWVTDDGRVMGCQTPAGIGGWETHKRSEMGERTYGTGVFLRLAAELRAVGAL